MTAGERYFIEFCSACDLPCEAIELGPDKSADLVLDLDPSPIIVEMKDFGSNSEDKRALNGILEHSFAVWGCGTVGNRITRKIKGAHAQLKHEVGNSLPAIRLLFRNRPPETAILSSYEIAVAMYGLETRVGTQGSARRVGSVEAHR